MAFTCLETWDAEIERRGRGTGPVSALSATAPILGETASRYINKSSATLLSAIVHLFLLWLLANKLTGAPGPGEGLGSAGKGMTLIDLSSPSAAAAARAAPVTMVQPSPSPLAQQTELDLTVPTELPPPEWSVARIRTPVEPVPRRQPAPPAPAPAQPSGAMAAANATSGSATGAGGAGAAGGGEAPYDPYAGAAPQRRKQDGAMASLAALGQRLLGGSNEAKGDGGELVLDRDALTDIAKRVARSMPGTRGTAEFLVRVSPGGMILDATPTGGSGPDKIRTALRSALVGKLLYSVRGRMNEEKMVRLPIVRL